jgi:hypothetical protein
MATYRIRRQTVVRGLNTADRFYVERKGWFLWSQLGWYETQSEAEGAVEAQRRASAPDVIVWQGER